MLCVLTFFLCILVNALTDKCRKARCTRTWHDCKWFHSFRCVTVLISTIFSLPIKILGDWCAVFWCNMRVFFRAAKRCSACTRYWLDKVSRRDTLHVTFCTVAFFDTLRGTFSVAGRGHAFACVNKKGNLDHISIEKLWAFFSGVIHRHHFMFFPLCSHRICSYD